MKNIQIKPWRLWAVEIITALLLVFFVHSAIDNYINIVSLQHLLVFYTRNAIVVSWLIVAVEASIAILLFLPRTRTSGYVAALLFFISLITVVELNPRAPHFFGGLLSNLKKKQYFPFEIAITALTVFGLILKLLANMPSVLQHKPANRFEAEIPG